MESFSNAECPKTTEIIENPVIDIHNEELTLFYLTNRFHVAVRLFSNRSQKTPKCGKNISDTLG